MKKCKRIDVLLVCVLFAAAVLALVILWENRGGIRVESTEAFPVNDRLTAYRQDDDRWSADALGESHYTMKSSGCIVTCIATALSDTETALTPGKLNRRLSEVGAYDSEGNLQWSKLEEMDGLHAQVFDHVSTDDIDECLRSGRYPIVRVHRSRLLGGSHYVLITGSENGEYICMDPLSNRSVKLSEYGNRVYALRCVWAER